MITGRYPSSHQVIINDLYLRHEVPSIADAFGCAGYNTAYIGKWHLDGHGRSSYVPPERRQGFDFWRVQECTHRYNESYYYGDGPVPLKWDGYDAIAQTREAQRYIRDYDSDDPFLLFLSWGPPHNPYETAPEEYRRLYDPETITLRRNVPSGDRGRASRDLAGYYAHITTMDDCIGWLDETLAERGMRDDTILVFTSDHGDMHGSQGEWRKQRPWDESILTPLLLRYPAGLGRGPRRIGSPVDTPDIMPTLLGLCGVEIPETVEGTDHSAALRRGEEPETDGALIACYAPFGEWVRQNGGREYRGVRTARYTYVRSLDGPWLLCDNQEDPYQLVNLCDDPSYGELQADLDALLQRKLAETGDGFPGGDDLVRRWGIVTDKLGNVPYTE